MVKCRRRPRSEAVVGTDVSSDHCRSGIEKMQASGELGAWKACMPSSGEGRWKRADDSTSLAAYPTAAEHEDR